MPESDLEQERARHKQELGVQRQIAFASGLFQGDITIRTLLESLAEGVVIIDIRGTILLVNTLAEQMFGYPNKDLIGKPHAVLIPERFRKIHEEHMAHFFAEPMIVPMGQVLDFAGRRRDGSEFPVEISLSFIETINGVLALAFVTDITLRKQFELQIRESEKLFRIQVEGVKDYAIFMLDMQGKVLTWNAGAERLKGYGEKEIIGKHFSCFYPEEERNAGKPEEELKKAAAEEQFEDEGWRIRKDGSRFWADVIITALRDENGNLRGFSKVTRDITGRKKVEDEIQDAREYAENIVETVREPLVVLNSDLKILTANHSFYDTFKVTPEETIGNFIYDLGNRQWDIPKLRVLFEEILPHDTVFNGYEVEHDFPGIGRKIILLNARQIFRENIGSHIILLAMEDITERKRATMALQISEEKFSKIFNATPALIGISTLREHRFIDVNQEFLQTLGYQREEIIGKTSHELRLWADESDRARMIRTMEEQGSIRNLETRFKGKTGQTLTGLFSAELIDLDEERHILSIVRDITERKQLEAEIQGAREYAENIVETVREPLVVLNSALKILTANHSFYDTFKVTPEETIGNFIYDLGNRQWDIPKLRVLFESILPHDTVFNDYEVEHDFLDIGRKTILLNARQIFRKDIGSHIILLAMEDITERKKMEDAQLFLVQSGWVASGEDFFKSLARYLAESLGMDYVCIDRRLGEGLSAETVAIYLDGKFEDNVSYNLKDTPCGDVVGKMVCTFPEGVHNLFPRDVILQKMLAESYVGTTLWSSAGQPIGLIAIIGRKPLVNRQLAEWMLRMVSVRAAGELERREAEQTLKAVNQQLQSTALELKAAYKDMESFSYAASHDLKSPLITIEGFSNILLEDYAEKLDDKGKDFLTRINNSAKKMNKLIGDLLSFSRVSTKEILKYDFNMEELAQKLVNELTPTIGERDIKFEIKQMPSAYGDLFMMNQALLNLLTNAIKFTHTRENAIIEVGGYSENNENVYYVRDNGIGFDMKLSDRLFGLFQRIHSSQEVEGTGIGLVIVKNIIEKHGGRVWAEGRPDEGAKFCFTLPRKEE